MNIQNSARSGNGSRRTSPPKGDERLSYGLGWFSIGLGLAEVIAPGKLAQMIGAPDSDTSRNVLRAYGLREIAAGIGILAQPTSSGWLWTRVAGDMLDIGSLVGAMMTSDADRTRLAAATAAVAGVTAIDIYCGQMLTGKTLTTGTTEDGRIRVTQTIIVERSPEEVYRYWRDFENFPKFMNHLQSVTVTGGRRSHWVATGPAGKTFEWDAEMIDDQPGRRISWRSLPGSQVEHTGTVSFERATGDRGTMIRVELVYDPPAGKVGAAIAKMFRESPRQQIYDDLRAFKQIIETGHKAKSDASIFRKMHAAQPPKKAPELAMAR